jgi:hypothetical protein
MKLARAGALASGFLLLATGPIRAWDALGHMLVAQIAYDQLDPNAKNRVDESIARFNAKEKPDASYDAITAACWMDDVRSRTKDYNLWHYVNLPYTPDGMPAPDGSLEPNVIWGIQRCEDIISGKTSDPAIDRDQALVMLEHLIGDIHQPLHTTSRADDAGGNKVKVANLKDPLADLIFTKGGNLHFFWDSAYRRVYRNGSATVDFEAPLYDRAKPVAGHIATMEIVRREATAIEEKYPPATLSKPSVALDWAKESHAIGYQTGYQSLPVGATGKVPVRLNEAYVQTARTVAEKRIALAGYRLANVLNTLYATEPPTAAPAPVDAPVPSATPAASEASPTPLRLPVPSTGNPAD